MNFEVTSMDFQEPACCDDGRLYSLDWIVEWIAGLDFWTGFWRKMSDYVACKTACVVKTYALQGHTDVAEPWKRGARFTIILNKATN